MNGQVPRELLDRFSEFSEPEQLAVAAAIAAGVTHLAHLGPLSRTRTHRLFVLNDALGAEQPDLGRVHEALRDVLQ